MNSQEYVDLNVKVNKITFDKIKSLYKEKTDQEIVDHIFRDVLKIQDVFSPRHEASDIKDADEFDFNPYLDELNSIVSKGDYKDISDQPNYFENMAKRLKSIE